MITSHPNAQKSKIKELSTTASLTSDKFFGRLPNEIGKNIAVGFNGDKSTGHVRVYAFVIQPDKPVGEFSLSYLPDQLKRAAAGQFPDMEVHVDARGLFRFQGRELFERK